MKRTSESIDYFFRGLECVLCEIRSFCNWMKRQTHKVFHLIRVRLDVLRLLKSAAMSGQHWQLSHLQIAADETEKRKLNLRLNQLICL